MSSGSIHDLRSSHPQPLGSGRLGASKLINPGVDGKQISVSMVEGTPDSPFKKA